MPTKSSTYSSTGPDGAVLTKLLGRSRARWDTVVAGVERAHAPIVREWHFAPTTGRWHLRLKQKARTILYLLPGDGEFLTAFIFGERAEAAVRAGEFPEIVTQALDASTPCGAGRGIRLPTKNQRDVALMLKLAAIKVSH
jgi:hypothetical protein